MQTTKERILAEALQQFNEQGIGGVSIRTISSALGISAGNLTYHFKNTDSIIQQLYLNLVAEIDNMLNALNPEGLAMGMLVQSVRYTYGVMYHYRFILLDFAQIGRRIPSISEHFRQLVNTRVQQFAFFNTYLQQIGVMQAEKVPGHFDTSTLNSILFGNAWLMDASIHFPEGSPPDEIIDFYTRLMLSTLIPVLTDKGIEEIMPHLGDLRHLKYPEQKG